MHISAYQLLYALGGQNIGIKYISIAYYILHVRIGKGPGRVFVYVFKDGRVEKTDDDESEATWASAADSYQCEVFNFDSCVHPPATLATFCSESFFRQRFVVVICAACICPTVAFGPKSLFRLRSIFVWCAFASHRGLGRTVFPPTIQNKTLRGWKPKTNFDHASSIFDILRATSAILR